MDFLILVSTEVADLMKIDQLESIWEGKYDDQEGT